MIARLLGAAIVGAAAVLLAPAASYAAVPIPDSPCTLFVPARIDVGQDVRAGIDVCPAGALDGDVHWQLDSDDGYLRFWFQGGEVYSIYGMITHVSRPGTYRISPTASMTFLDRHDSQYHEAPLLANAVTAKYRLGLGFSVTRSAKARPTSRVTVAVRLHDPSLSWSVTSIPVTVYRDGRIWKTARTDAAGMVIASLKDTKGPHTYRAEAGETATSWPAHSTTLRR